MRRNKRVGTFEMKTLAVSTSLFILFGLAACNDTYEWNQRLTVTIEGRFGQATGSSVTRIATSNNNSFWMPLEARGIRSSVTGEAVVIETPTGEHVFVLLDNAAQWAFYAYDDLDYEKRPGFGPWSAAVLQAGRSAQLPADRYPRVVTFDQIDSPLSVRLIETTNDGSALQSEYRVISMTLELVDEAPQIGHISTVLPWLTDVWPNQLDGQSIITVRSENRLANSLSVGSFSTEFIDGDL